MEIKCKKSGFNASKTLYVFYFDDKKEFDYFLELLEDYKKVVGDESKKVLNGWISKFKSRVDDKYKSEEYELSGCLFDNEMADFTWELMLVGAYYAGRFMKCEVDGCSKLIEN